MVRESTDGKMAIDMKASLHMIREKVWENIFGAMAEFIKVNGRLIE